MDLSIFTQNARQLLLGDFPGGPAGGLILTILIGLTAILASTCLGVVVGVLRDEQRIWVRLPTAVFIEGLRSIPLVMVFFWIWFVPPFIGLEINKVITSIIALSLFTTAYIAEIVRGGIYSVPYGQREAALSVCLTRFQALRYIVIPQALRNMLPALTSRYMVTMKNTSLAFLIGLSGFTGAAKLINSREYAPIQIYAFILVVYFILNRILLLVSKGLERRLMWEGAKEPLRPRITLPGRNRRLG